MKTKKRKFSPAQLAAQARFAKAAKAGTLKRKKRNTTIIKAKKISHLDVSKIHNPLASAKKRKPATKRNSSVSTKLYSQLLKAENAYGRLADKFGPMSKQAEKAWKLINTISERIKTDQLKQNGMAVSKKRKPAARKTNPRRGTRAIGLSAKRFARQASTLQGKAPSAIYTAGGRRLRKQYLLAETRFQRLKDSMRAIGIKYGASSPQWYKAHETATKAGEHLAKVQQKYFDYGEKAKSLSPNPNGRKRTVKARKNGANTSLAKQRRSEFVGRPSTQMKTLYAPAGSGAKGTLAQLGKLHKISVKGGKVYNFKGVPTLAQHPKTDQLFVLGKNYTVNVPKKNPGDRLVDLGEVTRIEYEAVKTHLGDTKPVTYYHHFGEEGGKRPHALVNEEGLIIFSGGDYYIRPEGIRD